MTNFRHSLLTGAAAGFLCLFGVLSVEAQDIFLRPALEAFVDKDTLLVFPAQLDTFQKVRVRKNENPVFGTVVRYENESGTCADVYIYSLDTGSKPVQQDMFEAHCRETDEGILKMPEQNPKISSVVRIAAPDRKTPEGGYESYYRIQSGSTPMDSVLFLALYHGKLVKVRISYSAEDTEEAEHARLFVAAIAAMLTPEKIAETQDNPPESEAPKSEAPKSEAPKSEAKTGA